MKITKKIETYKEKENSVFLKRFFVFVLIFSAQFLFLISYANAFQGGDGTEGNPYQISTCQELQDMRNFLTSYHILISDIDCSDTVNWNGGAGFVPVGRGDHSAFPQPTTMFKGYLYGNNKVIRNLVINRPSDDHVGLFGVYKYNGNMNIDCAANIINAPIVDNLTFLNPSIRGRDEVGTLFGYEMSGQKINHVIIKNGYVNGRNYVGGIIGNGFGPILCNPQRIAMSSFEGDVVGSGSGGIGGISGFTENQLIEKNYSKGNVSGSGANFNVGGLVGEAAVDSNIQNCYSQSNVTGNTGNNHVGGISGEINASAFADTYASFNYSIGTINCNGNFCGGLFGSVLSCPVTTFCVYLTRLYWDTITSGQALGVGVGDSLGTYGRSTAQMKTKATYVNWDFSTIWGISENITYPCLLWEEGCVNVIDIGLRVYNGTETVAIAAEPTGTLTSPLRIAKNGVIYGVALVNPGDPNDSGVRIQTSSGIKALRKLFEY